MIKITSYGPPVIYSNDTSYNQPNCTGAIQWNGLTKKLEVSNGSAWLPLDNTVNINTSSELTEIMVWAKKKMTEEKELEILAKENPSIADLVKQIDEKKNQIQMVKALIKPEVMTGLGEVQVKLAP